MSQAGVASVGEKPGEALPKRQDPPGSDKVTFSYTTIFLIVFTGACVRWNRSTIVKALKRPENLRQLRLSNHGLEKECLRVRKRDGALSCVAHPAVLGSALTHPFISTDFSEAQLELITPTFHHESQAITHLSELHRFICSRLKGEFLWPASMPCHLPEDESDIPIAQYGSSFDARVKEVYRRGLAERHGRRMQMISGIHYNVSFSIGLWKSLHARLDPKKDLQSFISDGYLHIIRNFLRLGWLNTYLFGASPAMDKTGPNPHHPNLSKMGEDTRVAKYATSLRLSALGYYSRAQDEFPLSYNSLDEMLAGLESALSISKEEYHHIGVFRNGEQRQLNDHLLQMAAEHYVRIRPKRRLDEGESLVESLRQKGIEYVEVRAIDLNPFEKVGLAVDHLNFLHMFLLHCLLSESPPMDADEAAEAADNQQRVAWRGREPRLSLVRQGRAISMKKWALAIVDDMRVSADLLDTAFGTTHYRDVLHQQIQKIEDVACTPSAWMLDQMKRHHESFDEFGWRVGTGYADDCQCGRCSSSIQSTLEKMVTKSHHDREKKESYRDYRVPGHDDMELSTQILISRALRRGIDVDVVDREDQLIRLSKGNHVEYVKQASITRLDSMTTHELMGNKHATKYVLNECGVRVPDGALYTTAAAALHDYSRWEDRHVVVKPKTTNYGIGIGFVEKGALADFKEAVEVAFSHDKTILVEEYIKGPEYRLLVIGDRVVSVVERIPANVMGDGVHTISELVDIKNATRPYFRPHDYRIQLTSVEIAKLREQKLKPTSILKKGRMVMLRQNSNVSTGGDVVDRTSMADDFYKTMAVKAAHAVGSKVCGVDMIIPNAKKRNTDGYAIIELNYNPMLMLHYMDGVVRDSGVVEALLKELGF